MKFQKSVFALLPLVGLISCSSGNSNSDSASATTSGNNSSVGNNNQNPDIQSGYQSEKSYYQIINDKGSGISSLPSIGDVNILVIPIQFTDYPASGLAEGHDGSLALIEDTFFGERDDNTHIESVTSYYEKSSYNKLHIHGTVMDWYTAPYTCEQYSRISSSSRQIKYVQEILTNALNYYESSYDLSSFDTNGDKYFDAVWMVYSAPMNNTGNNIFWAYTTWADLDGTVDGLSVSDYSWASYQFLLEGGYTDYPDAHTFIHETGHLLGLDDYYNYDSTSNNSSYPTGSLDMMAYNIGDHMALSKYDLGWISPTVVWEDQTLTIDAFENSGEAILVAAPDYNNSQFWEYYLIQYYTPTSLNYLDSQTSYNSYPKMYTDSGILVYHINQKIGGLSTYDSPFGSTAAWNEEYIQDLNTLDEFDGGYEIINANSPSRSCNTIDSDIKLVELVSAAKNYKQSRHGENKDLFAENTTYLSGDNRWEDGTRMDFSFTVSSLTADSATLSFTFTS